MALEIERRVHWASRAGALCFFATACLGGQTGGEFGPDDAPPGGPSPEAPINTPTAPEPNPSRPGPVPDEPTPGNAAGETGCATREQEVALADASRLGFSAVDMLDATLGVHTAALHWNPSTGVVNYGPEQGESVITLSVAYDDGSAYFVSAAPKNGAEVACAGADHLEVDVTVKLETSGGALAEAFPARLVAQAPGKVALTRALPLSQLAGSFFVDVPANHAIEALNVSVTFEPSSLRGELSSTITQTVGTGPDASVGAMYVKFAYWP